MDVGRPRLDLGIPRPTCGDERLAVLHDPRILKQKAEDAVLKGAQINLGFTAPNDHRLSTAE